MTHEIDADGIRWRSILRRPPPPTPHRRLAVSVADLAQFAETFGDLADQDVMSGAWERDGLADR
jgi:hypothetical protein